MFPNNDPSWHAGASWSFGWVVPLVLVLVLAGVVIWAVVRLTRQPAPGVTSTPSPVPPRDPAFEQARLRYAQGQLDRETFLRIAADLEPAGHVTEEPTVPEPPA